MDPLDSEGKYEKILSSLSGSLLTKAFPQIRHALESSCCNPFHLDKTGKSQVTAYRHIPLVENELWGLLGAMPQQNFSVCVHDKDGCTFDCFLPAKKD